MLFDLWEGCSGKDTSAVPAYLNLDEPKGLTVDLRVFEIVAHLLLEEQRLLEFLLFNLSRNVKVFLKL